MRPAAEPHRTHRYLRNGLGGRHPHEVAMDDPGLAPLTTCLIAQPTARRSLLRLIAGSLPLALAWSHRLDAQARRRSRKHKHRNNRHGQPSAPPEPIAPTPPAPVACHPTATSGITGLVLIGPMCPVVSIDEPCPDRPFVAKLIVRNAQGTAICTTASHEDGRFQIGLSPGAYVLDPQSGVPGGLTHAAPMPVTVEPNRYTDVTITFDSGLR